MKFNVRLSYKELQIIKHALQHYVYRPNSTDKEIGEENRVLMKITNEVDGIREKYNIEKFSEKQISNMRNKFGKHRGHYEWDLAVEWFQTSNDMFFEKYGFNFVPTGKLFDEAKEYVYQTGRTSISNNISNNLTVNIAPPELSLEDILKGVNKSVSLGLAKSVFKNRR